MGSVGTQKAAENRAKKCLNQLRTELMMPLSDKKKQCCLFYPAIQHGYWLRLDTQPGPKTEPGS